MNAKRSLRTFALSLAILLSIPVGWIGYQVVTGQPIGANTLLQTDAASGSAPAIRANGQDANISINIVPKGTGTVQINGVPVVTGGGTTTSLTVNPGPLAVTGTTNLTGPLFVQPGTSGVLEQAGGAVLFNSTTQVPTVGTGEETAYSFSIPGNTLSADNQWLSLTTWSTAGATGTNKQLRVKFGATTISDSTAANFASGALLWVECKIFRTGAATQRSFCAGSDGPGTGALTNGASTNTFKNLTTPAETLSGAVTLLVTQQSATAANQTANGVVLRWYPAGQ